MDEIGRGTSTFDGLSLAWSAAVYIAEQLQAFTLFATHYFELTALPETYDNITNVHLDAAEHNSGILFLHRVKTGPANQSYGLQVAQLAGIPASVIDSARGKLTELEQGAVNVTSTESASAKPASPDGAAQINDPFQAELFGPSSHPALEYLEKLNPDEVSAREALAILYELKKKIEP
jgi:DNA mismatch repair protein MutS